ncbi:hypothetical protein OH807_16735 [Kitasatospora sp. NBC_01560]|uniref:hypothetical protein n=1 Tax=Kitasatospora sp. NBC_01560 TaxID=2975965 RepID=UPI00386FFAD7
MRRVLGAAALALATGAAALGPAVPATAAPAPAATASGAPGELVLPAAPRGIPARDQLFVAGDTGLLHAREGSDRLLWTRYDTGATTDTGLRLPAALESDLRQGVPSGYYRGAPDHRYGTSSDTVAVPSAGKVDLYSLATGTPVAAGSIGIPAGQTYAGTYGRTVLTSEGTGSTVTGWYLNRLDGGTVVRTRVALPAAAALVASVHDGDRTSVILRYRLDDVLHSALVDLATGSVTELPDGGQFEFSYTFRLAKNRIVRHGTGMGTTADLLDRAQPQTVLGSTYVGGENSGELRLAGDWLIATASTRSSGDYRGRPLGATPLGSTSGTVQSVLDSADTQLLPAPDGSLIAIGTEHVSGDGQRDTAVYRLTGAGERPAVAKLTDVPAAPATVFGLTLGGGTLTVASDTVDFHPADTTGSYRSHRLSGAATPVELSETLNTLHDLTDCYSATASCATLRSTGDQRFLAGDPVYGDRALAHRADSHEWGSSSVRVTGIPGLRTMDAAGRYVVLAQSSGNHLSNRVVVVGDLDTGAQLLQTAATAAAVQGETLWRANEGSTTVTATDVTGYNVHDTFTAPCRVTMLQAVGRWVHWGCQDNDGTLRTSGVFDTATRKTLKVPVIATGNFNNGQGREALLGDGYLVRQDRANGKLLLLDFRAGIAADGDESSVTVRTLASGDHWKTLRETDSAWTVDRTGPDVAWTDPDGQRIHVVNATAEEGSRFTPLAPARLLDTREAVGRPGSDPVAPGGEVSLQIAGRAGVPQSGVKAVVLNMTVTEARSTGILIAWPSGTPRPDSSNLNWTAGQTVANQVVVPVGADGRVDLRNAAGGSAHLIADVFGYYSTDPAGSTFSSVNPARLLDTREAVGRPGSDPVPAGGEVSLQVAGRAGLPQSGVKAVVLNTTVTEPQSAGFLTAWPSGTPRPDSSNLNWTAGQTLPNHVVVPVGADGRVNLRNAAGGTSHLIADVFGYYSDDPAGSTFHSAGPSRLLDTRQGPGAVAPGGKVTLDLSGRRELAGARTVVLNVTVTEPQSAGFLTAWPSGTARPDSSNLNWTTGATVANLVTVPIGADGKVELANLGGGSAQVIADVFGYFS